jgi:hypothetical protein
MAGVIGKPGMKVIGSIVIATAFLIAGCFNSENHSKGLYMLLDPGGTYEVELKKAQVIVGNLLGILQPNDTLAVASIETGNFSDKDIIARATFQQRPSVANNQKRLFQQKLNAFVSTAKTSPYTDISGGILQAIEYLNRSGCGKKYILIFSDLDEPMARDQSGSLPFQLSGFQVVAFNVTHLRRDIRYADKYLARLENWRAKVENGNGKWRVINDVDSLENIFSE